MTPQVALVAFDLDGTLLRGDTVCQAIARRMGHLERMNEFERRQHPDEIAAARAELAGYYATTSRDRLLSYLEGCQLAPGAEQAFALLRLHGIQTAIVSITWSFSVDWFASQLGADYAVGTLLDDAGMITHFWPHHKAEWLGELMTRLDLVPGQVAAIGDSWGDIAMLEQVDHRFFVGARLPDGLNAIHLPDGDIHEIAQRIVAL